MNILSKKVSPRSQRIWFSMGKIHEFEILNYTEVEEGVKVLKFLSLNLPKCFKQRINLQKFIFTWHNSWLEENYTLRFKRVKYFEFRSLDRFGLVLHQPETSNWIFVSFWR